MSFKFAYDIETFPNFLSYLFIRIPEPGEPEGPEDVREFVVFEDRDDRGELGEWIRSERPELIGFNNYAFDDLILAGTLVAPSKTIGAVYDLGQKLIRRSYEEIGSISRLRAARDKLETIDLMLLLGSNYNSLKEIEGKLGIPILELPFPFDKPITAENVPELLEYNRHDVRATIALYRRLEPVIETRRGIGSQFGIHALNSTDSELGNRLLNALYSHNPGSRGTPRDSVKLSEVISQRLRFDSPQFCRLLEELREITVTRDNGYRFSKKVAIGDRSYQIGTGGIHSEDEPGIFETGEYLLRDCDVTSYYPSMMLNLGIFPEHLGAGFLTFYRDIVEKRLEAKSRGDSITANGLKITVNAVFGKLNYEYFWLYDPKAFLTVTVNGQLFLLDLIEKLEGAGIRVLSANTDGVLSAVSPELEERYSGVCKEWEERTGFSLEFEDYARYIRRDVNNYLAQTVTGKVKAKGVFIENPPLSNAYRAPVIARAIRNYFLEGVSPEDTLEAEASVMGFAYVYKPSSKFRMGYQTSEGIERVPRVNRYYIAREGGTLVRLLGDEPKGKVRDIPMVRINGELPEGIPDDLDMEFYLSEIRKIIDPIEGRGPVPAGYSSSSPLLDSTPFPGFDSSYSFGEIVEFTKAREEKEYYRLPCPLHEGHDSRSLRIKELPGGKIDLQCFAGCNSREVLREIERRIDEGERFRSPSNEPLGEPVTSYEYRDQFGRTLYKKNRYEPKTFRIFSHDPNSGDFLPGMNGNRPILYRYPEVLSADHVIIVEGEKDSDNGTALELEGYAFTTNYDGAGNWNSSYSRALAHKNIVVIPDNDPPGREHGRVVANSVAPFAKSVRILELPEGKDLSDWIELGNSGDELRELIEGAKVLKTGELFEENDLLEFGEGDPGNARAVLRLYGDSIAFTDGFGPMYYEGSYWTMGGAAESRINRLIEETLWRRRDAALKTRDTKFEPIIKSAFPSVTRINSTRKMLSNYCHAPEERFGNPPGLLNCLNGVIDMRTGELFPAHPEYGFTYRLDTAYKPGARSAEWERFLEETLPNPEEREYLQEIIGYIYSGETREEKVVHISGPTRSGKGTFTETLQYLGGELANEINIRSLIDSRSGSDQNFDLAGLHKARFVHASESKESDWLDSSKIKLLSGGNTIRAAYKGRDLFEFRPQFTVVLTSNEPPRMKAEDSAAWYRLLAFEFPNSKAGNEDKRLKGRLRERENLEGILNWVIEGAIRWYSRPNGLETPNSILERTKSFREALDYIMEFIEEGYEQAPDLSVNQWDRLKAEEFHIPIDALYADYKSWHETNGAPELNKVNFARKVRARLGGINLYENLCKASIKNEITGESKQKRVIAGIRPKKEPKTGSKAQNSIDDIPF